MTDAAQFQALSAAIDVELSIEGATRLLAYLDAMLAENEHINLTAIRERGAAVMLHAFDSVAIGACQLGAEPEQVLDLGTGNGFPGVAVACLFPRARVVLMDRRMKKLQAIMRALGAAGFETDRFELAHMDAKEAKAEGLGARFDLITTRAVGQADPVGKLSQPLLAPGGRFAAWLSDGAEAPPELKCGLKHIGGTDYDLPAPALRRRRIACYGAS